MDTFDVVVSFEERVFDLIVDGACCPLAPLAACADARCFCRPASDLHARGGPGLAPVLVLNLDVRDNAAEAAVAAPLALELCRALAAAGDDWEGALEGVLAAFEATHARRPIYSICYY